MDKLWCAKNLYYYQNNKKIYLTPVKSNLRDISNIAYCRNSYGTI